MNSPVASGNHTKSAGLAGRGGWPFSRWSGLFLAFAACWIAFFFLHPEILPKVGVSHYRIEIAPAKFHEVWFLDTLAILASNDAIVAGVDPYGPNRFDAMHRPHVYGPAWLYLRHFGLTRADRLFVGGAWVAAFVLGTAAWLRPNSAGSLAWFLAIFCTTPVLAAIERGNNDLVVYAILIPIVPCLLSRHAVVRWLALPLIALATALKYYPAMAGLILLAPGPMRELRWRVVGALLALALVVWHVVTGVPGFATIPKPEGILSFGGVALFHQLGIRGAMPQIIVLIVGLAATLLWWRSTTLRDWRPLPSQHKEWLAFVLGGAVLTGCFFVGQNYAYRWVFALFLAPLLWSLPREPHAPLGVRRLARVTGWLLLVMLWAEAIFVFAVHRWPAEKMTEAMRWMTLGMQPLTWAFFLGVLGFLVHFTRLGLSALRKEPANLGEAA